MKKISDEMNSFDFDPLFVCALNRSNFGRDPECRQSRRLRKHIDRCTLISTPLEIEKV
jgi:hypothetical protein